MSMQRVLILCHDVKKIVSFVQSASLKGVHFSILPDWESSAAALQRENFSVIVAQKILPNGGTAAFVSKILAFTPKTPLILVLPENEGPSVLDALKGGASEILFEETLGASLAATLEKYLFSGYGLLRRMSLDELFDFCIPVITTTDMNLLAGTILEKFREALGASFGVLFQEGGEGNAPFTIHSAIGFAEESASISFLRRFGESVVRHAGTSPSVIPMEKLEDESPGGRWALDANRFLLPVRFELESGTRIYSVVGLRGAPEGDAINSPLLNFFCRQARLSLINAERSAQVQSLIYIDDLTKLYNSRYLNVVIDREMKRSERYRNFFSVLFMDIDFFKRVNDTHGHLVGSRVLQEVGTVLRSCVRDSDTVARYGGDEFVVLLVETNSEEAMFVAERMRKAIEAEHLVQSMGLDIRLTISIGIAAFPEHATSKTHLLNLADQAMYRGKESTRNVVYLAQPQKFP
jgi:diguanylate cyclase (GGDEF)-like protein